MTMLRLLGVVGTLSLTHPATSQYINPYPRQHAPANYSITVNYRTAEHTLQVTERIYWWNTSSDTLRELWFHAYLNAYRDEYSTFMKGSPELRRAAQRKGFQWGGIDIQRLEVQDGEDLTPGIEYVSPDDGNPDDRTVIRVPLATPLLPNTMISLRADFRSVLPSMIGRVGVKGDFVFAGQWFLKLGVYEAAGVRGAPSGRWNCRQYHPATEFYADFGVYDMVITLPQDFKVGASGFPRQTFPNADGTTTHWFTALGVHDMAWTASRNFTEVKRRWEDVTIRLLLSPGHGGSAARYAKAASTALDRMKRSVGRYPYPTLTIVDPPMGAWSSGGMEYPTLVTGWAMWGLPGGIRFTESVTVHEVVHQYWYGMVASNEFEEAWLDEGLTQYYEARIMDDLYGNKASLVSWVGFRAGVMDWTRSAYVGMRNPQVAAISTPSWKLPRWAYGPLSYSKPALMLATLEGLVGRVTMDEIMQTYFQEWRFRHPQTEDFVNVAMEVVQRRHGDAFGGTVRTFFDQVLSGTGVCDYAVAGLSVERIAPTGTTLPQVARTYEYRSTVTVNRLGEVQIPVDVALRFPSGKETLLVWDGRVRQKTFVVTGPEGVSMAVVDPEGKIPLDINVLNNSILADPSTVGFWKYTMKFLFWVQNILLTNPFS